MTSKKRRTKNRRRAQKLCEQAWDAADEGNFSLAVRIIRRAVDLSPGNPVLWHDQGVLLKQYGDPSKAAKSFEAAISLATDFAEAYANLAEIRMRRGMTEQAVRLQAEAVKHAPDVERYRSKLAAYESLVVPQGTHQPPHCSDVDRDAIARSEFPELASRIDSLDWPDLQTRVTQQGFAHLPEFLMHDQCQSIREMYANEKLFRKTVTMNRNRFGNGVYRYFAPPIPHLIDAIRRLVYPLAARICNDWQQMLSEEQMFPSRWQEFYDRCANAGQRSPSPLLLRYESGGFNALHQDIRGNVFFPLQLVIVLSKRVDSLTRDGESFNGGEFLVCDQPLRKESDRHVIFAGLGDAVLFCTRARPVLVAGVYGLKPVKHGMARVTSGTRYAVGIPFHEFLE